MPAAGNHPRSHARYSPSRLNWPPRTGSIDRTGPINAKEPCLTQGSSSHYQVLRIPVTATEKDIKVAYRKAARTAHPDHGGDAATFRRVTLAYETLIDARRRAEYDRSYGSGTTASSRTPPAEEGAHFDAPAAGSRA